MTGPRVRRKSTTFPLSRREQHPIAKALASRAHMRSITRADGGRFQAFFDADPLPSYANTWTYITQAANCFGLGGNDLGYIREEEGFLVALGFYERPTDERICFHLINPQGRFGEEGIPRLAGDLHRQLNLPIYVKKVSAAFRDRLLAGGAFNDAAQSPWHTDAVLEDDTYPEVILTVDTSLALLNSDRANQLKEKHRRFLRHHGSRTLVWRELDESRHGDAWAVVQRFFTYKRDDDIDISTPADYANMLLYPPEHRDPSCYYGRILYCEGEPVSLLVMERIGKTDCLGLYCNLALYQEYKYLSEFVLVKALELTRDGGHRYLNLGGSESRGLHAFKMKFQPELANREAFWLELIGASAEQAAVPASSTEVVEAVTVACA